MFTYVFFNLIYLQIGGQAQTLEEVEQQLEVDGAAEAEEAGTSQGTPPVVSSQSSSVAPKQKKRKTSDQGLGIEDLQASLHQSTQVLQQLVEPPVRVKGDKAKRRPFAKYVYEQLMEMSTPHFKRSHQKISQLFAALALEDSDEETASEAGSHASAAPAGPGRATPKVPIFQHAPPPVRPHSAPLGPSASASASSSMGWQPQPHQWIAAPPTASPWKSQERGYMEDWHRQQQQQPVPHHQQHQQQQQMQPQQQMYPQHHQPQHQQPPPQLQMMQQQATRQPLPPQHQQTQIKTYTSAMQHSPGLSPMMPFMYSPSNPSSQQLQSQGALTTTTSSTGVRTSSSFVSQVLAEGGDPKDFADTTHLSGLSNITGISSTLGDTLGPPEMESSTIDSIATTTTTSTVSIINPTSAIISDTTVTTTASSTSAATDNSKSTSSQ